MREFAERRMKEAVILSRFKLRLKTKFINLTLCPRHCAYTQLLYKNHKYKSQIAQNFLDNVLKHEIILS